MTRNQTSRDTAYQIATDIKLITDFSAFRAKRKNALDATSNLLVEGSDDKKIYSKFISKEHCRIWDCGGKPVVMRVVNLLEAWQPNSRRFLAITDCDYDSFHNKSPHHNQVNTSGHDLEVMALSSPALDLMLDRYLESETRQTVIVFKEQFREQLFALGSKIGYIRMKVYEYCKSNEVFYDSFLQGKLPAELLTLLDEAGELHFDKAKRFLRGRLPGFDGSLITRGKLKKAKRRFGIENLCHGKDMREILRVLFRQLTSRFFGASYHLQPDFTKQLFDDFSSKHFRNTQLYKDIQRWESANWPCRVLSI